eukprot:TRINITY_DN33370_c0_g1_i1.p1 TRINITY_DN33370_c0_g1~~TRINITY_DN33370_c0_g1_i1.p1  ORF type:complete len:987 (+),score=103.96 TRINITY_DN33370_c0_g1_i1:76-2961(+)
MSGLHPPPQPPAKKIVKNTERIKVAVRVRPMIASEKGDANAIECSKGTVFVEGVKEGMGYDYVFGGDSSQKDVYREAVSPLVDTWVNGYNACLFAYGQTGSGKTFTMLGPDGGHKNLEGMIPQVADDVFRTIKQEEKDFRALMGGTCTSQFQVRASYVEVYNDDVRDLLATGDPPEILQVRECDARVYVEGCKEVEVTTSEEVMKLIYKGSRRRATGRTNMNQHSSRSHAVFTMVLEHRWRVASDKERQHHSKTSYFNLVDLAGSERSKRTGNKDTAFRESVAINTGLLALGNVIAALSGLSDRRGSHVPYRDSTLTRLLQSSLGGDSRTVMMACVSPAKSNIDESTGTLKYAQTASCIKIAPKQHVEVVTEEAGPMDNDIQDPDEALDRRCLWIDTAGFGSIYARCVGDVEDPLILFIHGSGPTNSSTWWNGLVHELAVTSERKFFMVCIDCPGYGRTVGDRQDIRSTPGALVQDIVQSLGRTKAFCIVGSSQGCCSTFNAVLEKPDITDFIVVMDPVGHDVFRYKQIKQPALLIFDTEDAGHPVKVGRWMRDNLPYPHYHEFSSKKTPYWHVDHMAGEMLNMFKSYVSTVKTMSPGQMMTRLAGGLIKWCENQGYGEPIKQIDEGFLAPPSTFMEEMLGEETMRQLSVDDTEDARGPSSPGLWERKADPRSGRIFYYNTATGDTSWKRPRGFAVVDTKEADCSDAVKSLFVEEEDEPEVESEDVKEARINAERSTNTCDMCGRLLWHPIRIDPCRHVMCRLCHERTLGYNTVCPVLKCKVKVERSEKDADHHAAIVGRVGKTELEARECEDAQERHARDTTMRVVLEYGNTSSGTADGEAHTVTAFMKVSKVEKGKSYKNKLVKPSITRVDFNINPRYPKSAVRVTTAPFELTRTMASKFPCDMTIRWSDTLPPTTIPYTIQHQLRTTRRAVIQIADPSKKPGAAPIVMPRNGFPEVVV